MQKYRLQNSEILAMQWTRETHGQVVAWLQDHDFEFHLHDEDGEVWANEDISVAALDSMCIDTRGDLEIELGWWLTWNPATQELSFDTELFDQGWKLVTE